MLHRAVLAQSGPPLAHWSAPWRLETPAPATLNLRLEARPLLPKRVLAWSRPQWSETQHSRLGWRDRLIPTVLVLLLHGGLLCLLWSGPQTVAPAPTQVMTVALMPAPTPLPPQAPAVVPVIAPTRHSLVRHSPTKSTSKPVTSKPVTMSQLPVAVPLPSVTQTTSQTTTASVAPLPADSAPLVENTATPASHASSAPSPAGSPVQTPVLSPEMQESPPKFGVAYLHNPAPEYPQLSQRAGEEGRVLMRVVVSAEGLPASVEVLTSSGFERLDKAAVAAVKQWRFEPARKGSQAITAAVNVPLSFTLKN